MPSTPVGTSSDTEPGKVCAEAARRVTWGDVSDDVKRCLTTSVLDFKLFDPCVTTSFALSNGWGEVVGGQMASGG